MVKPKRFTLDSLLLLLIFALFPFGKITGVAFQIAIAMFVVVVLGKAIVKEAKSFRVFHLPTPKEVVVHLVSYPWTAFITWVFISFVVALLTYPFLRNVDTLLTGTLYLARLLTFILFTLALSKANLGGAFGAKRISNSLIAIAIVLAVFAWVQYIFVPDLRQLFVLGWDDHFYRLVGTLLDPGFAGIMFVLAFCIAYFKKHTNIALFFALTTAFTYSRASYLALLTALAYFFFVEKNKEDRLKSMAIAILFVASILLLPKPGGTGVELTRTYSVVSRFENYKAGITLLAESPIYGFGYNNLCSAKREILNFPKSTFQDNSCAGFDSSLVTIATTTGVVGLVLFICALVNLVWKLRTEGDSSHLFAISILAVIVHSFFVNSLLYPWVLFWLGVLLVMVRTKQ